MIVNLAYLDNILNPLVGGADDDDLCIKYQGIDVNNENLIKGVIRETIKPEFELKSKVYQVKAKSALAFALICGGVDFERVFNRNLLPFDHPEDARFFFMWLWQELFNDELLQLDNFEKYTSIFDIEELLPPLK